MSESYSEIFMKTVRINTQKAKPRQKWTKTQNQNLNHYTDFFKNCSHMCISLCTTVVWNTTQNCSDYVLSYSPNNHYCSDAIYSHY